MTKSTLTTFWSRLEELRRDRGLTIHELWVKAGMSEPGYYSRKRAGHIDLKEVVALAEVLKASPVDLLMDAPQAAHGGNLVGEPAAPYARRYLEDRVELLEQQLRDVRKELRARKPGKP